MDESKKDSFLNLLDTFDKLNSIEVSGRISYKPLYDYFMIIIKELGVERCGFDEKDMNHQLKARWDSIKWYLDKVEDSKTWNKIIYCLHEIRRQVEHDDFYNPSAKQLKLIREKSPEFKIWMMRVTNDYYKITKDFSFKESFCFEANFFVNKANRIIHEYGDKTPYVDNPHIIDENEVSDYNKISELLQIVKLSSNDIARLDDIQISDLKNLIKLVHLISNFEGKEEILLMNSVCPKCGDEIKETQEYFGGRTESQPEPDGIYLRIGCQGCDYYIHDDTIYI